MKTYTAKPADIKRDWYVIDARGKVLGRLATEVARRLRGKHKPEFTPNMDTGDYIVVVNAKDIRVTGRKFTDKIYHRHSNYPGGVKSLSFEKMREKNPAKIIEIAVKGMLPKGPMGRQMFRKLRVYSGPEHEHASQQPLVLEV